MQSNQSKAHWDHVYANQPTDGVSWFQVHADRSLRLIESAGIARDAEIIDVGGGVSTLLGDLLASGYSGLTSLDLSAVALAKARARLGAAADKVRWIEGDVTTVDLPEQTYDLWHDRAVFHFLLEESEQQAYVAAVRRAVKPGGFVIVATFDEDGPSQCSGLTVARYSPAGLHARFGPQFELLEQQRELHRTPSGVVQKFIYCCCRRLAR